MDEQAIAQKLQEIGGELPRNIFSFSDGTRTTEWNVAFHYAVRLQQAFRQYDCDFDLSKVHEANKFKRPDIVLHQRGHHDDNFLVIEMKIRSSATATEKDAEKIRDIWFANYNYKFGATVMLNKTSCNVKVYPNLRRNTDPVTFEEE